MLIPIREQVILSLAAHKTSFSSSLYLVNFEMIKSFDVSDKIIFFGSLSLSARQMMAIVIISSVCKYSILVEISFWRC